MIIHGVIHDISITWLYMELYMVKFVRFDWRDSYLLLRVSPVNSLGWGCVWGSCMLGSSFGAELGLWRCSTCQPTAQEGSCGLLWSSHNQFSPNHSQQTPLWGGNFRTFLFLFILVVSCAMLYLSVLWSDSATSQWVAVDTIKVFEFEFELYEAVCITSQWMGCMWFALCSALFWSVLILVDFTHIFQDYLTGPNSI